MNWNAVIIALRTEAKNCARRASTSHNPEPYKSNEILKMEIYIDLAMALNCGMNEISKTSYVQDAWPEK